MTKIQQYIQINIFLQYFKLKFNFCALFLLVCTFVLDHKADPDSVQFNLVSFSCFCFLSLLLFSRQGKSKTIDITTCGTFDEKSANDVITERQELWNFTVEALTWAADANMKRSAKAGLDALFLLLLLLLLLLLRKYPCKYFLYCKKQFVQFYCKGTFCYIFKKTNMTGAPQHPVKFSFSFFFFQIGMYVDQFFLLKNFLFWKNIKKILRTTLMISQRWHLHIPAVVIYML